MHNTSYDLKKKHESFNKRDAVITGVSPDPINRHQTFVDKLELPFELLADEDHEIAGL